MWDEITYPFPNFNGVTLEVWEWISNFIPCFIMDVIMCPCWDWSQTMVVKGAPGGSYGVSYGDLIVWVPGCEYLVRFFCWWNWTLLMLKPCSIIHRNWVNTTAINAMNPCVTRSTKAIVLIIQDNWAVHEKGSQLSEKLTQWNRISGKTRTTRMPAFWDTPCHPMITHSSDSYQIPSQNKTKSKLQILKHCQKYKFCKKLYTRHTSWNCLIRGINMKWIQPELWALHSGHGMWDGRRGRNQYTPQQLRIIIRWPLTATDVLSSVAHSAFLWIPCGTQTCWGNSPQMWMAWLSTSDPPAPESLRWKNGAALRHKMCQRDANSSMTTFDGLQYMNKLHVFIKLIYLLIFFID